MGFRVKCNLGLGLGLGFGCEAQDDSILSASNGGDLYLIIKAKFRITGAVRYGMDGPHQYNLFG